MTERVLHLRTFGGIVVLDEAREPIVAATAQRRPAALLAALAVAGDAGLTRDKILGLLWSETESSRASHSLTQALYSLRRATGIDDLFVTGGQIRLNRQRMTSDVGDMEHHLDAGEADRGVELYSGPFLDGFFITGAPEFEEWSSQQRTRLESRVAAALEILATRAEQVHDFARGAEWRGRQSAIRPYDSEVAARRALALARAGDRAGALLSGQAHETLLREDLDIGPDPSFVALMRQLRDGNLPPLDSPAADRIAIPIQQPAVRPPRADELASLPAPAPSIVSDNSLLSGNSSQVPNDSSRVPGGSSRVASALRSFLRPRQRRSNLAIAAATTLAITVAVGVVAAAGARADAEARARTGPTLIVAPFDVSGTDPSLSYLHAGIARLLQLRLGDDSVVRSLNAGEIPPGWRPAGSGAVQLVEDSVMRLVSRLGGQEVIVGTVVGTPSRVIINAKQVALPSGTVLARARAEGPSDSLRTLVDRLGARLLVARAGQDSSIATRWSHSMRALRFFLDGRRADAGGDYSRAVHAYEAALHADSAFVPAAIGLAVAAKHLGEPDRVTAGLAAAWEHRASFDDFERAIFAAFAGPRYPRPSTAAEQLAAWDQVLLLARNSADSWYHLAMQLVHDGRRLGATRSEQATVALNRTLAVNPDHGPAKALLDQLSLREAQPGETFDDGAASGRDRQSTAPTFLRWRRAVARGDSSTVRRLRAQFADLERPQLRAIAMSSQFDAAGLGDGLRAIRLLASTARNTSERVDAILAEHSAMMNAGRSREALAATERLRELRPDSYAHLRLRIADALYGRGDAAAAAEAANSLTDALHSSALRFPGAQRQHASNMCALGQWRLANDDTTGIRSVIDTLRELGSRRESALVGSTPSVCAELLDAALAVATERPDALAVVERLNSLVLNSPVAGNSSQYSNILISRLFGQLGQPQRALEAIRKRGYMSGWPAYLSTALLEESRLAREVGDATLSAESRRRFLALRAVPAGLFVGTPSRSTVASSGRRDP